MTIAITGLLLVDINYYKYTGKITYSIFIFLLSMSGFAFLIRYLKKKKEVSSIKNPRIVKAEKKNVIL
jgi:hypothetical protein